MALDSNAQVVLAAFAGMAWHGLLTPDDHRSLDDRQERRFWRLAPTSPRKERAAEHLGEVASDAMVSAGYGPLRDDDRQYAARTAKSKPCSARGG
jgi:hypothetical protein